MFGNNFFLVLIKEFITILLISTHCNNRRFGDWHDNFKLQASSISAEGHAGPIRLLKCWRVEKELIALTSWVVVISADVSSSQSIFYMLVTGIVPRQSAYLGFGLMTSSTRFRVTRSFRWANLFLRWNTQTSVFIGLGH